MNEFMFNDKYLKQVCKEYAEAENWLDENRYSLPKPCFIKIRDRIEDLKREMFIRTMNKYGYNVNLKSGLWEPEILMNELNG